MRLEGQECWLEYWNLTPMGDFCACCLSFNIPLKDTTKNGIGTITTCVEERIPWALADPTCVIERSAEIKLENTN